MGCLGAGRVRLLGRIEAAEGSGRGVELIQLLLQAGHVAGGQLSPVRQERPLSIVGDQLPLERGRAVRDVQAAGREQRPARLGLHRDRVRGRGKVQLGLDPGRLLGELRQRLAYLAPA